MQVRGTVAESRMTLDAAIGKNTTEGKTHMMCVEGTEGQNHMDLTYMVKHHDEAFSNLIGCYVLIHLL